MPCMDKRAWQKAVEIAAKKEGSLKAVASRLGISPQAIAQWDDPGPPAKHVLPLEAMSGVSRYLIRPDIYGEPPRDPRKNEMAAA